MSNPDSKFLKRFSVIIGLLVVIALALVFLSRVIMDASPTADEPAVTAAAPAASAQASAASADAPAAAAAPAATATAANATPAAGAQAAGGGEGATVYQQVCSVCHAPGIAGAPKVGDAAAWAPRIAQGKATLYDHALHGLTSKTGVMAPKAGRSDLSDASVEAAVDYMVAKSSG